NANYLPAVRLIQCQYPLIMPEPKGSTALHMLNGGIAIRAFTLSLKTMPTCVILDHPKCGPAITMNQSPTAVRLYSLGRLFSISLQLRQLLQQYSRAPPELTPTPTDPLIPLSLFLKVKFHIKIEAFNIFIITQDIIFYYSNSLP